MEDVSTGGKGDERLGRESSERGEMWRCDLTCRPGLTSEGERLNVRCQTSSSSVQLFFECLYQSKVCVSRVLHRLLILLAVGSS